MTPPIPNAPGRVPVQVQPGQPVEVKTPAKAEAPAIAPPLTQPDAPSVAKPETKPSSKTPPPPLRPLLSIQLRPQSPIATVGIGGPNPFLTMPVVSETQAANERLQASLSAANTTEGTPGGSALNGVAAKVGDNVGGNPASGSELSIGISGTLDVVKGKLKVTQMSVGVGGKTPLGSVGAKLPVITPGAKPNP